MKQFKENKIRSKSQQNEKINKFIQKKFLIKFKNY